MFIKENDLYEKIDYMKRMSNINIGMVESVRRDSHIEDSEYQIDEEDEEEKEIVEMNFTKFTKKQKADLLRRPRLFILPNAEKLKEMIKESLGVILAPKSMLGSQIGI